MTEASVCAATSSASRNAVTANHGSEFSELPWPVAGRDARALASGEKTSHRIPVVVPSDMETPDGDTWMQDVADEPGASWTVYRNSSIGRRWSLALTCPFGAVGDRLWIQEAWRAQDGLGGSGLRLEWRAERSLDELAGAGTWQHASTQPRQFTRLILGIVGVEIQRLRDLSAAQAQSEGYASVGEYAAHWDRRHPSGPAWADNPWVWAIELSPVWARFPRQATPAWPRAVQRELELA